MARKNLTPRAIEDLNRGRICDPITPGFGDLRFPETARSRKLGHQEIAGDFLDDRA